MHITPEVPSEGRNNTKPLPKRDIKPPRDTFIGSLKIQTRVIWALFLREIITRYGRHGLGFLWLFLEPMMFSVGVTILWTVSGMVHMQGNSMPMAGFALTGYSAIVLWRNMVNRLANNTTYNKGLLYHPNVRVLDLIFSRGLLEFAACSLSLVLLTLVFWGLGLMELPVDPLKAFIAWALFAWFVFAAGMVAAFLGESSEIFERVVHVILYLALPLTGAFTMVSWMPQAIQKILLLSPLVNGVEMLREGYFGMSIHAEYSVNYVLVVNLFLTLAGLILIRNIRRQLIDD
jgi:ABC-type polysaccharide/polyol phosphate export permease